MFCQLLMSFSHCLLGCILLNTDNALATLSVMETVIHTCDVKTHGQEGALKDLCQEKVDIVLKTSLKLMKGESQFVTVNKAYCPEDREDVKLLNPLVIHVYVKDASLLYPLEYVKTVNNKAYEVFFHKDNTKNYEGCKKSSIWKLCGRASGQGSDADRSLHGFCCSCDSYTSDISYHVRSGQDCSDTHTPLLEDSTIYHSSTHCLKFDSLWYHVYQLKKPSLEYNLAVEIYRVDGAGGLIPVVDDSIVMGTSSPNFVSSNNEVFVSILNIQNQPKHENPLGYKRNVLLIPEQLGKEVKSEELPLQLQGNASEFLVLNRDHLALSGGVCDKVGVSYRAFVDQRHRCLKSAQSCFKNQPMHFWLHDIQKQLQRKPTKYFLSGFTEISSNPLVKKSANLSLSLLSKGRMSANLILQAKVDNIYPTRHGKSALITKITHTKAQKIHTVTVSVYNPGLVRETYTVSLHSCNTSQITSKNTKVQVDVPAHHSADAVFKIHSLASHQVITCTVSVSNYRLHIVSERGFWFREEEICICLENISCTCQSEKFQSNFTLQTDALRLSHLHSVIVQGYFSGPGDHRFVLLIVLVVLIIIGFVKGLLSLAFPIHVGQWGLCLLLRDKPLYTYYERELEPFDVTYNEDGVPVHPVNHNPVQLLSRGELMFLNLFFGFYMIFILPHYLLSQCRQHKHHPKSEKNSKEVDSSERAERQSVIIPQNDSPQISFNTTTSLMSKSEKELVLELYKKQKQKLLHHKEVSQSLSRNETGSYRYDITSPDPESDESPSRRMTRIKDSSGRQAGSDLFLHKQTLNTLLQTDPVYCNIESGPSIYIKNSGNKYSLCGTLAKEKRKFVFQLGDYTLQTYENVGFPKLLSRPQRILHPISFTLCLTSVGVHKTITMEPLHPCLNRKI